MSDQKHMNLASAALGERFQPMTVSEVARLMYPRSYGTGPASDRELNRRAARGLSLLAFRGEAVKVASGVWSRRTTDDDWRKWLSVMTDELAEGEDEQQCELAMRALESWSRRVDRIGGTELNDWEPVAVKAIEILCRPTGLREPKKQTKAILSKAIQAIWRGETWEAIIEHLGKVRERMDDEADMRFVSLLSKSLRRYELSLEDR